MTASTARGAARAPRSKASVATTASRTLASTTRTTSSWMVTPRDFSRPMPTASLCTPKPCESTRSRMRVASFSTPKGPPGGGCRSNRAAP
eukprot:6154681-Alexandrium_andersonii.AAC.1